LNSSEEIKTYGDQLFKIPAFELIFLYQQSKIKPSEYLESLISRIEKLNPILKTWVHLDNKRIFEKTIKLDAKQNFKNLKPLFGIPIGIKDVFNTWDFPTEMGSKYWKGFTPGNDARVVHDIRMDDGIVLGKTDCSEFSVHSLGTSKNPYDDQRTPGTSSSGSAVAVSTFMVPISLGSQTAGSIIRPASYCGIYGFKPSYGLIPRTGMLKTTDTLDHIGFFSRNPLDLELIFNSVRVKGRDYPLSESALNDTNRQTVNNRPWKIKFIKTQVWEKAEEYTKNLTRNFIARLSQFDDFEIEEFSLPDSFNDAHKHHEILYKRSLYYYFKDELQNKENVSDDFFTFASAGSKITQEEFEKSTSYQSKLRLLLDNLFNDFDIIITYSTAGVAPMLNEKENEDTSLIWTMCGTPSASIPALKTSDNLPLGIQVVSRRFNDYLLLNFIKLLKEKGIIEDGPYPPHSFTD
jgi:Asp-tRNA(Asn)/Glu-tRNA(Gln) amidotransferase A subunit family amidase